MRRWRWTIIGALAALAIAIVAAVAVEIRVDSGEWRVPKTKDFVRIARRLEHKPSHAIFLERQSVDLRPGDDDAAAGLSSIVASAKAKPVHTRVRGAAATRAGSSSSRASRSGSRRSRSPSPTSGTPTTTSSW